LNQIQIRKARDLEPGIGFTHVRQNRSLAIRMIKEKGDLNFIHLNLTGESQVKCIVFNYFFLTSAKTD